MEEEFVKIVIDLPDAEDGVGGEGVWSVRVGEDLYEVRNSPWYTTQINYLDVVRAIAPGEDKKPVVQQVIRRGGHRTIHIFFFDEWLERKDEVLDRLKQMSATFERAGEKLFAVDLEPVVDFDTVADYLAECEEKGWLDHRYAPQPQSEGSEEVAHHHQ